MRYYSDLTKKFYDNAATCEQAEKNFMEEKDKEANARAEELKNLDVLLADREAIRAQYKELMEKFNICDRKYKEESAKYFNKYHTLPEKHRSQSNLLNWFWF